MESTFNKFGTAHADTSDRVIDWDEVVTDSRKEYVLLQPGTYPFKVTNFERRQYHGSEKMPPCPQAVVTVAIDGGEQGEGSAVVNFFLTERQKWKLAQFFVSIGILEKGGTGRMDWTKVVGATGMCELYNREYKDNKYNEIKKWLAPESHEQKSSAGYKAGTF